MSEYRKTSGSKYVADIHAAVALALAKGGPGSGPHKGGGSEDRGPTHDASGKPFDGLKHMNEQQAAKYREHLAIAGKRWASASKETQRQYATMWQKKWAAGTDNAADHKAYTHADHAASAKKSEPSENETILEAVRLLKGGPGSGPHKGGGSEYKDRYKVERYGTDKASGHRYTNATTHDTPEAAHAQAQKEAGAAAAHEWVTSRDTKTGTTQTYKQGKVSSS